MSESINGVANQQSRIRYYVMNLIYRNSGKSVRVPSSRELARQFGIARSTVQLALGKLVHEGYLISRHGAATMTNPCSSFVLQPQSRNPLIGVKLYEGDTFFYGCNFWRIISSVAGELTERNYNIRLLNTPVDSEASIRSEVFESYLDGMVLVDTVSTYVEMASKALPCVAIGEYRGVKLPAVVHRSEELAVQKLAEMVREEGRLVCYDITNPFHLHHEERICSGLQQLVPQLRVKEMLLEEVEAAIEIEPPQLVLHYEQHSEALQRLVDRRGLDVLLVCRKQPAREARYRGWYMDYHNDILAQRAVSMLGELLAGKAALPEEEVAADLRKISD